MLQVREEIKAKVKNLGATITGLKSVPHIVQGRPLFDFVGVEKDVLKELKQSEDDLFQGNGIQNIAIFPDGRVESLATVSNQYNLVQHLDAINSTLDYIPPEFGLDKVNISTSPNGGRAWAKFYSKKDIEILPGDKLTFIATLQNSADTSKVYRMLSQVMRQICTNGMMAPDSRFDSINIRKLHKGTLDLKEQVSGFFENMEDNLAAVGMWKDYAKKKIETPQLEEVFKMLEAGPRVQEEILGLTMRGENTSVQTLLGDGKLNAWNVYNAFTQRLTDSDSKESVKIEKGSKLTETFDKLIAA